MAESGQWVSNIKISILEMRRITHLHDSAHFTIPLSILSILKSNSILKSAILSVAKNKLKQKFFWFNRLTGEKTGLVALA